MNGNKDWFEYHLTPRGWELGSNKTALAWEEKDSPADRVLTVRVSDGQPSPFGKPERMEVELWRSQDPTQLAALISQFGRSPG